MNAERTLSDANARARAAETGTPNGSSSVPGSAARPAKPGVVRVDASSIGTELIGVRNANADAPELERGVVAAELAGEYAGDGDGDVPASDGEGCQSARARTSKGSRVLSLMMAAYGEPSEGSLRRHAEYESSRASESSDARSPSPTKNRGSATCGARCSSDATGGLRYGRHRAGSASANTSVPRGSHAHEGTRDATSSSRPEGVAGEARPEGVANAEMPEAAEPPAATAPSARSPAPGVTLARPTCLRRSCSRPASLSGEPSLGEGVGPGANATRSPCISFAPVQRTRADTSISARTSSDVCLSPTPPSALWAARLVPAGDETATAGSGAPLRPDARSLVAIDRDRASVPYLSRGSPAVGTKVGK